MRTFGSKMLDTLCFIKCELITFHFMVFTVIKKIQLAFFLIIIFDLLLAIINFARLMIKQT